MKLHKTVIFRIMPITKKRRLMNYGNTSGLGLGLTFALDEVEVDPVG
jgi:hypothetical protein